jgi:hypothetical protein
MGELSRRKWGEHFSGTLDVGKCLVWGKGLFLGEISIGLVFLFFSFLFKK